MKELGLELVLVSKELNHFGVIAGLFRQIGGHSSRFVPFCVKLLSDVVVLQVKLELDERVRIHVTF